jgi:Cu2+-exporting ATPase
MTCCTPADTRMLAGVQPDFNDEIGLASRDLGGGIRQTDLSVPGVHCAGCMAAVEKTLSSLPGVASARVNLSLKRVAVTWRDQGGSPPDLIGALRSIGYEAHLFSSGEAPADPEMARLIRALAVAGFSAMNIMILSVSVWSGADAGTRHAFHLISAVLALPAILYSGRIFFGSAWSALRHGRTNMDVPISLGVSLAFALSLYDTLQNAEHAYFDAAVSLLFFLLIGRTLDHAMRERARSAVAGLARLAPLGATVVLDEGRTRYVPLEEIEPGTSILLAAGDRIPVDGVVEHGRSEVDTSLVSGESVPRPVEVGAAVQAGALNLVGPVRIRATARAEHSFLAEMTRMMEAAEGGRARYRRLADRASALYSPVVHGTAFISFLFWLLASGDWHQSITIAIAVLIVTCPCALGLAVPIVQVVAARRLFERGIMVRNGSALERLAEVDRVVLDKTGTLTLGKLSLRNPGGIDPAVMAIAIDMARCSRHPASVAITGADVGRRVPGPALDTVEEFPGLGLEARSGKTIYRLGRPGWATKDDFEAIGGSISVLKRNGEPMAVFVFDDRIRPGASEALRDLAKLGLEPEILSGDRLEVVAGVASQMGVARFSAGLGPGEKVVRLRRMADQGRKVLMVGDGLNDAPALSAAHVSMTPATAADVGRSAADFVFLSDSLSAVPEALAVARRAGHLIRQNFALAVGYNVLAVPVAAAGHVTPLLAAIAMSVSSVVVVANAMRLGRPRSRRAPGCQETAAPHPRLLRPAT